jgi:hypothetical protein
MLWRGRWNTKDRDHKKDINKSMRHAQTLSGTEVERQGVWYKEEEQTERGESLFIAHLVEAHARHSPYHTRLCALSLADFACLRPYACVVIANKNSRVLFTHNTSVCVCVCVCMHRYTNRQYKAIR